MCLRVNPGLVTQHSSQFPTGTSHRRNYRFLLSHNRLLILFNFDLSIKLIVSTVCLQLLEQLRSNRASLKPPQLQMLGQLEAQLAMMQQHQHQVKRRKIRRSFTVINPADLNHKQICKLSHIVFSEFISYLTIMSCMIFFSSCCYQGLNLCLCPLSF